MLPRNALLMAVVVGVVAFYCKLWNVKLLQPQDKLYQELLQNRQASEPVIVFIGRSFFVIAAAAWVVLSIQSVVVGIRRARYKPQVQQPLQPLSEDEAQQTRAAQQQQQGESSSSSSSSANAPSAAGGSNKQQQHDQQQQQPSADWRDERRLRTLDAAQRALDEQAAALRAKQEQEEEERRARRAEAAAAAATLKAQQEAAREAARAEAAARAAEKAQQEAERKARWNQAVSQQWRGVAPPRSAGTTPEQQQPSNNDNINSSSTSSAAAAGSSSSAQAAANAAAAAAVGYESPASILQQQDAEYQQALARDRAKAAAQRAADAAQQEQVWQQQQLTALRVSLQQQLSPEPSESCGLPTLTLRVRLPGGAQASRRFARNQGFGEVLDWVYSLEEMPLWTPGSWSLMSSFPRRQLAPPSTSMWAPGVWQQQQQEERRQSTTGAGGDSAAAAAAGGEGLSGGGAAGDESGCWLLKVYRLASGPLWVRVSDGTTLGEVQQLVEQQTGIPAASQRVVFMGRVLTQHDSTLAELNITPGTTLHLAVSAKAQAARTDDELYGAAAAAAASTTAATAAAAAISDPGAASSSGAGAGEAAASAERRDVDSVASGRAQELAKAAEHAYLGSGDVLVVGSVAELQQQVAAGAPLLALYVGANT